jgi:hypothetical protein
MPPGSERFQYCAVLVLLELLFQCRWTTWSAAQAGGEQRKVEATPELERALRDLRERLAPDGEGGGEDDGGGGGEDEFNPNAPYPNV